MLAKVLTGALVGIDAVPVEVEVDIAQGLPQFATVGLAEGAVKESKDRIKSAIQNSGYNFPNRRITINLAPADIRKDGAAFDLPMALGLLSATEVVPEEIQRWVVMGELSLDGRIKPVKGILPVVMALRYWDVAGIIVPLENLQEAQVVAGVEVRGASHLSQIIEAFNGGDSLAEVTSAPLPVKIDQNLQEDFADVRGQEHVKRALEIAAAGGHNALMAGSPGSGKTMLARRLPTILPQLSFDEALDTTRIHSIVGLLPSETGVMRCRPFRSPHHSISDAGLIGGGTHPRPGEVSLSHNGVLFLDELPEFKKNVLEMLRQPLEDGQVTISRAMSSLTFPADFMLVAAMNPCPCGYQGDNQHLCTCTPLAIQRYRNKLSGPLLDRIDLHVQVPRVPHKDLTTAEEPESSAAIRDRVEQARQKQRNRLKGKGLYTNAQMGTRQVREHCRLNADGQTLLETVSDKLGLSARSYTRILKLARTIADLAEVEKIEKSHLMEAIQYRGMDRKLL